MLKLRDYQTNLINSVRSEFKSGYKRVLACLPCGAGKTICFAYMASEHISRNNNNYVWFLVHRSELVDQTKQTFKNYGISTDNIYVGMVYTALRRNLKKPTMIIFDEAHHTTAKTWLNIINTYSDIYTIGLTATPTRLDGTPLGNIWQRLVVGVSAEWLINNKYLSNYDYYAPANLLSDFNSESDNSLYEYDKKIYGNVLKYIDNTRKTIIYCPNIAFSQALSQQIPNSKHFDGNTPAGERRTIINDFRTGKIRALLNVDLIGEGFDVPDCDCVILLRPTHSTALYIQQSMRCLRAAPNKHAVIYDLVGNVFRHDLPTANRTWSLTEHTRCRNKSATPDILTRQCKMCYRVYSGTAQECPYCHYINAKTQKQIKIENDAELTRITKLKKREQGQARTLNDLIAIGKQRGYKNPVYWATMIIKSRQKSSKNI